MTRAVTAISQTGSVADAPRPSFVSRQYFWRPELTNLTDEALADRRQEFLARTVCSSQSVNPGRFGCSAPRTGEQRPISKPSRGLHVRMQESPNWFTPSGVAQKRRMLEAKGMPSMKGWRFITLTLNPELFEWDPLLGYETGRDQIRRFLEAGRLEGLWPRACLWAWKMEFQSNGWAHWHIPLARKNKFTKAEMQKITDIWRLGRTNVRRITSGIFGYHFKYVFKGVFQDDDTESGLCVPRWFLDHYKPSENGNKPSSFSRVRFWQTSKGFYTNILPAAEPKEPQSSIVPRSVSDQLEAASRAVVIISRRSDGKYIKSRTVSLGVSMEKFIREHLWDTENGVGCTLSAWSYIMDPLTINKLITKEDKWKLQPLHQSNRLTMRVAQQLRRDKNSLQNC